MEILDMFKVFKAEHINIMFPIYKKKLYNSNINSKDAIRVNCTDLYIINFNNNPIYILSDIYLCIISFICFKIKLVIKHMQIIKKI